MTLIVNDRRVAERGDALEERVSAAVDRLPNPEPYVHVPPIWFIDGDALRGRIFDEHQTGRIGDLARYAGEEAAIRWDIDVANVQAIDLAHARFIKLKGYWRCFANEPNGIDYHRGTPSFVAQWEPDEPADATGIPGRWLRRNSLEIAVPCAFTGADVGPFTLNVVDKIRDRNIQNYPPTPRDGNYHRVGFSRTFKRGK